MTFERIAEIALTGTSVPDGALEMAASLMFDGRKASIPGAMLEDLASLVRPAIGASDV